MRVRHLEHEIGEVELAARLRVGDALPDGHGRGASGHMRLQIGIVHRRQAVHRVDRHAVGHEIDGQAVIRDRGPLRGRFFTSVLTADLDALKRTALDPLDHPCAHLRYDQDRPYPFQRGCRHRRSREAERQPRLARIVDAAGSGDADLAIADIAWVSSTRLLSVSKRKPTLMRLKTSGGLVVVSGEHDGAAGKTRAASRSHCRSAAPDAPAA